VPVALDLLPLIRRIRTLRAPATLRALASTAGWSPFHLHRAFRRVVRETPKQYLLRLQLEQAAVRLVTTDDSVLNIALACGFENHETFTRAFRRHFGAAPSRYRSWALADSTTAIRLHHAAIVTSAGPCIGLYHFQTNTTPRRHEMPTLSIVRKDLTPQPVVFARVRVARHEIPAGIAEALGKTFPYAMQAGLPIAGKPYARYLTTGPGLFAMEVGVPLAAPATGQGDVEAGALPGGPAVVAVHGGPYDQLGETYAAMERWMDANGVRPGGPAWESYVTDPGDYPDPADWRTEVFWPIG